MSGDDTVTPARARAVPTETDVYRRSEVNIRRLNELLPESLVENLAREVILRVASKGRDVEHVPQSPSEEEVRQLCLAFVAEDQSIAARMIADLRADGVRPEEIYLKQLAAAARMLGEMWLSDEMTFTQVTIGTGRMFAVMRGMRHLFEPVMSVHNKAAIFAAVPGEDHTLGVHMAADIFRKDGWEIALKVGLDHDQLVAEIEQSPTSIVGLSISGEHSIEALSRLVVALHISCPHAMLLVSGSNVAEVQPILSLMGLDGIAATIEEAQEKMSVLWDTNMAR